MSPVLTLLPMLVRPVTLSPRGRSIIDWNSTFFSMVSPVAAEPFILRQFKRVLYYSYVPTLSWVHRLGTITGARSPVLTLESLMEI